MENRKFSPKSNSWVTYEFFPDPPIKMQHPNFDTTWARDVSSIIFLQN